MCADDEAGLATRLFIEIDGVRLNESVDLDEVAAFWEQLLPDPNAINDLDLAFAFVQAPHAVWLSVKPVGPRR